MTAFVKRRPYIVIACVAALSGCATMSADECRRADWQAIGLKDGMAGTALARLQAHREACAEVGIQPDAARWSAGHAQGLLSYCTPNAAWNAGLANQVYQGVCTALDEPTFVRYHRAGQAVWRVRQDLSRNRTELSRLEGDLRKAGKDDERKRIREEMHRLERERDRLTALLVTLELAGPPR